MKQVVLAADLGGTNLRMAAVDDAGKVIFRVKNETPQKGTAEEIIQVIIEAAEHCRANLKDEKISAITAAVPASIDYQNGLIKKTPNLPMLDGFPLVKILEKKLGITALVENDANSAAIGENWLGASKGFESSITVTLGTGVGGGIILKNEILRGADGTAAEIGHICVEPFGKKCGCGSYGCVEQYSSATAVVRHSIELADELQENSESVKDKMQTSEQIFEAAKNGDEIALESFRRQGFYLGIALSGLINTLNPEIIVIGGGASAGWDLFVPELKKQISVRAYKEPASRAKIVRAELGDDAGILGAAKLGIDLRDKVFKSKI